MKFVRLTLGTALALIFTQVHGAPNIGLKCSGAHSCSAKVAAAKKPAKRAAKKSYAKRPALAPAKSPSQSQAQNQGQAQSADTDIEQSGNDVTVVEEAPKRAPVSTAYAPALTSGLDTCMGSSSLGAQGVGFGISAGTTWTDENCIRLKNSRELRSLGFDYAALALLCQDDDIARAFDDAGELCPGREHFEYEERALDDSPGPQGFLAR